MPEEEDAVCPGMVLDRAPEAVADIEVRKLTTFVEHCAAGAVVTPAHLAAASSQATFLHSRAIHAPVA